MNGKIKTALAISLVGLAMCFAYTGHWLALCGILLLLPALIWRLIWAPIETLAKTHAEIFHNQSPTSRKLAQVFEELCAENEALRQKNIELMQRIEGNIDNVISALDKESLERTRNASVVHSSLLAIEEYLGDGLNILENQRNVGKAVKVSSLGPMVVLNSITQVAVQVDRLRQQMYSYKREKREHIGGSIVTAREFCETAEKIVKRFGYHRDYAILSSNQVVEMEANEYIFHDLDYTTRLFYFICNFIHSNPILGKRAPQLHTQLKGVGTRRCEFTLTVIMRSDLLPAEFNDLYDRYFWSNTIPVELASLDSDLVEALKMSAYYSVLVRRKDDDFGNTCLIFERITYRTKNIKDFFAANALREKIPPADVFFVSRDDNKLSQHLEKFITQRCRMEFVNIDAKEFSPAVICHASRILVSQNLCEQEVITICRIVLDGPLVRINVVLMGEIPEAYRGHPRVVKLHSNFEDDELFEVIG